MLAVLLKPIVSSAEQKKIIYRIATLDRLENGIGPRRIGRELWVTRQTISAIKKSFHEKSYRSSHVRGHEKRRYTPDPEKPKKKFYRNTKYGRTRVWNTGMR